MPFRPIPRRAPNFRAAAAGGCPCPLLFQSLPRRGATVGATSVGRMPFATAFGPIPLQHRCRRRKRLDCPTLGAAARMRDKLAIASPRSFLRTPPAPPHRREACASHQLGLAGGSARVANDPRRALKATGCHGLFPPRPRLRKVATPTRVPERTEENPGPSSEELAPNRGAHGNAKYSRCQTLDPTARVIGVAANGDPAQSLGGDHLRESVQYGTRRDAWSVVPRRSTRHGAVDPLRTAPPEDETAWSNPTDRMIQSAPRGPLATHSVELREDVATSSPSVLHVTSQLTPHPKPRTTPAARKPPLPTQPRTKS
jgi:hypothetical protein